MRVRKFIKLLVSCFVLFLCHSNFVLASNNFVCSGNLCIGLKKAFKTQDFLLIDNLYAQLLTDFEKEKNLSYVDWSTMVDLTKSYEKFCIEHGRIDKIVIVIDRLLQKFPPEVFHRYLCFLKEHLNPNKLSLGEFLLQLEKIQNRNVDLFLDTQDLLFFNTYKFLIADYFESLRQKANKNLFLNNYEEALDLYSQIIESIKNREFLLSEEDKLVVLSEIEVAVCLTHLKQAEKNIQSKEQIVAFSNYFQAKINHEKLLLSLIDSFQCNSEKICSIDLGRNLFNLADFYCINHCENKAEQVLNVLVERTKTFDRTFKLGLLKLITISFERKDFLLLEKLLDRGRSFFQSNDLEYAEFCLYQGIFFYYQKKFDESQAYIKLSINRSETLGLKTSLALQYLGYALLEYSETQTGEKKEILLEEAYNTFLLLLNNWDNVEGLLGCFYSKVRQKNIFEWKLGIKLLNENLGKLSLIQKQLLFNLNLTSQFFPNFFIEKDIKTNNFYHLTSLLSELSFTAENNIHHLIKNYSHSLEKIIISLLRQEREKKLLGMEAFIQRFLNNNMKVELEKCLISSSLVSKNSSLTWYISLLKDFYEKNFQFFDVNLDRYTKTFSSAQKDILLCIKALTQPFSWSQNKRLDFLESYITPEVSYPQDMLKILFLDNASEQNLIKKRKEVLLWAKNSYFSEEIFFKTFPLYTYLRGDKEAIKHMYEFISLFSDSQFMPVAFYFLGIHQKDPIQAIHYLTTALEDYINITPNSYNQNSFTYFFYKTKLKLSLLLIQRSERSCLLKALELLENIKEDFVCLKHPLIKSYKEKYNTIRFELEADYLLTYSLLKLGEIKKLNQHLITILKKYTLFFDDPEINKLLYFLWSLQKKLAKEENDKDICQACENIIFNFLKDIDDCLGEENIKEIIFPLYPLL